MFAALKWLCSKPHNKLEAKHTALIKDKLTCLAMHNSAKGPGSVATQHECSNGLYAVSTMLFRDPQLRITGLPIHFSIEV